MKSSISEGLMTEGVLPGMLHLRRKASSFYIKAIEYSDNLKARGSVFAYALAASEENAAGNIIVTAPTCAHAVFSLRFYFIYKKPGIIAI